MNKNNNLKRPLVVLVAVLTVTVIFFSGNYIIDNGIKSLVGGVKGVVIPFDRSAVEENSEFSDIDPMPELIKAAENSYLILYRSDDASEICVYDKKSMEKWSSSIGSEKAPLAEFGYVSLSSKKPTVLTENVLSKKCKSEITNEKNGFSVKYFFKDLNIGFKIYYTLNKNKFTVYCPDKEIKESINIKETSGNEEAEYIAETDKAKKLADKISTTVSKSGEELIASYASSLANDIASRILGLNDQVRLGEYNKLIFSDALSDIENIKTFTENKEVSSLCDDLSKCLKKTIELADVLVNVKSFAIVSVDILPKFGACYAGTDGYAFYPDGNGAISSFEKVFAHTVGIYNQPVYDSIDPYLSEAGGGNPDSYQSPARIPVFGVKKNNSAFLSVIESGDFNCRLTYKPIIEQNATSLIYSTCYLRSVSPLATLTGVTVDTYCKDRIGDDIKISYSILSNGDADYNGMAREYRKYLLSNGALKESPLINGEMPLYLEFLIGINSQKGSVINDYILMTEFSDIEKYLERFTADGVKNITVSLKNWTEDSGKRLYSTFKPSKKAGGKSGIKRLSAYCKKKGIKLLLDCNLTSYKTDDASKSVLSNASVVNLSDIAITGKADETLFFNPTYTYNTFFKKNTLLSNFEGLSFKNIGRSLWFDFNKRSTLTRKQTAEVFLKLAKDYKGICNFNKANAYMFSEADIVSGMSNENSGYFFTTLEVPFIQTALYSNTVLIGERFNQFSDFNKQSTAALSLGFCPSYILTNESSIKAIYSELDYCFSTETEKWYDNILTQYKRGDEIARTAENSAIYSWEKLNEGVYRTTFENGYTLYSNTTDGTVSVNGITLEAYSTKGVSR